MSHSDNSTQRSNSNDADKKLSSDLKEILKGEREDSDINDPLFSVLTRIRQEDTASRQTIPVQGKASAWESITNETKQDSTGPQQKSKPAPVTRLHPYRQWMKVAAAVVLIACSALLIHHQFGTPDRVMVAESSTRVQTIDLADGSSVTLRPNSALYRLNSSGSERTYSLSGEALFDVVSYPGQPFSVEAGPGRVVVTGTQFNISGRGQSSRVFLIEGSVRFETADRTKSVDLKPGEASEIDDSMELRDPFTVDANVITGWTQNRLTFRDRRAGSIIDELEFHFGITVTAPQQVRRETLGGTIQLDSASQSLSDLGTVLGGTFTETSEGNFVFQPSEN